MVGIPLYGTEASLHDFVVQAPGAFEQTVRGILRLAERAQRIELRVVVQRHTLPALVDIAEFIARNLPFVEQVALMSLEMTGLARPNASEVWVDPADTVEEMVEAAEILTAHGIRTRIYNTPLCLLPQRAWPLAAASISDWKQTYPDTCSGCTVQSQCGGVFATGNRVSSRLRAVQIGV